MSRHPGSDYNTTTLLALGPHLASSNATLLALIPHLTSSKATLLGLGPHFASSNATLLALSPHLASGNATLLTQTDSTLLAVTIIISLNTTVSLLLNVLLVLVILYSPSLRTPPNSHLLSICANNLLLCLDMLLCALCLNYNSAQLPKVNNEALSGVSLFLTYNGLMQYWGTFASIGFYRYRTIRMPALSLRSRRKLVSRCVLANWIGSSLLGLTLSLAYSQNSRFAASTLDPFMRDFIVSVDDRLSKQTLVAVTLVAFLVFLFCLGIIITAYYSICRTLNVVSVVGRNRISPRLRPSNIQLETSNLNVTCARDYRPPHMLSTPYYLGSTLSTDHKDVFTVTFSKLDSTVTITDNTCDKEVNDTLDTRSIHRAATQRRQFTSADSGLRMTAPDFTDISIGAELLRFQKQQSYSLGRRESFRRETTCLNSAIRNSLAILVVYITCSLPLFVATVPGSTAALSARERLHLLLTCRVMFYLNAAAYPLWYMGFSVTVKRCLARLCEGVAVRYGVRWCG